MKTNYKVLKTLAIALLFSFTSWGQTTIAQWNFNGDSNTTVPGGETSPSVSVGAGTAQLVNLSLAATFASGNSTTGTLETVTTSPPNFAWQTTGYAPAGIDNKLRGVQFNVNTTGQAGIIFRFEQRLSNSASNTFVVQYTTDNSVGSPTWVDAQTFVITPASTGTGDTWYNARITDVSTITALNNNPNVAFRIVSAFDPIAGDYVAARSTNVYSTGTGGTVRYDMVTVTSNVTLGVSQFESAANHLKVFPNPSNKEIVTLSQTQDITISDVSGKVVFKGKNVSTIDTKSFTTGVYFIKTKSGITRKLIVK